MAKEYNNPNDSSRPKYDFNKPARPAPYSVPSVQRSHAEMAEACAPENNPYGYRRRSLSADKYVNPYKYAEDNAQQTEKPNDKRAERDDSYENEIVVDKKRSILRNGFSSTLSVIGGLFCMLFCITIIMSYLNLAYQFTDNIFMLLPVAQLLLVNNWIRIILMIGLTIPMLAAGAKLGIGTFLLTIVVALPIIMFAVIKPDDALKILDWLPGSKLDLSSLIPTV